jgi:hypothetical protein
LHMHCVAAASACDVRAQSCNGAAIRFAKRIALRVVSAWIERQELLRYVAEFSSTAFCT